MRRYDTNCGEMEETESAAVGRLGGVWRSLASRAAAQTLRQHEDKVILLLTLIIGATVGLVVVAFIYVTENLGARMYPASGAAWRRLVIPIAGSLITGLLLHRYFRDARGSGIPQTKVALFINGGVIRLRTVVGKFLCSSISMASGIALGREGPSVQIGAGIASSLGRRLGLSPTHVKSLIPIGAAAALAAAFNTPIAAVLFTLEEVMGDLHARVLGSVVLSSATSWMVLHLVLGDEPLFHVPSYQLVHPVEFAFYAVLGLVGGVVSVCFVRLLLWMRKRFLGMPRWTAWLQPAAGGLLVGALGWFVPDVLGVGYNHVSQALNGQLALGVMAMLVVLKVIATAGCYASGNAGGIFGPSLFIGAMLGGAVGGFAHTMLPDYTGGFGAYALVGMGTAFAGIIRVPLTSVIMIFEVTRDYSIIVPLMISNLISYFISSRLQPEPIYEALQAQDGIHLPGGVRDREETILVGDSVRPSAATLPAAAKLKDVLASVKREQEAWPVVDENGLRGMASLSWLEASFQDGRGDATLGELMPIDPLMSLTAENFPHVHADHPLTTVIRRMAQTGLSVLPVVSRVNVRELRGVISMPDVMAAYGPHREAGAAAEASEPATKAPAALLGGVIVALLVLLSVGGFLSYFYRAERAERAQAYFEEGKKLMEAERYPEAVERYRNALSISHTNEQRLALARALFRAGRLNEAGVYLKELLRDRPENGPANLTLARVTAAEGDVERALGFYRTALSGSWPADSPQSPAALRIELARTLAKAKQPRQAQAEALSLLADLPEDFATRKDIGRLLLDLGMSREAVELFKTLRKERQDADVFRGLAEGEFALNSFSEARESFESALRYDPADDTVRKRLHAVEQILELDPHLRRLGAAERYRRSRKLVEANLAVVDACVASLKSAPPASLTELESSARATLQARGRPRSYSDTAEDNVGLADQLYDWRVKLCGPGNPLEDPLSNIMTRASR